MKIVTMYEIRAVWAQGYDFTNDRGEKVSGTTTRALVLAYDDKAIVRHDIVKVVPGMQIPEGTITSRLLFDQFGRLIGYDQ